MIPVRTYVLLLRVLKLIQPPEFASLGLLEHFQTLVLAPQPPDAVDEKGGAAQLEVEARRLVDYCLAQASEAVILQEVVW